MTSAGKIHRIGNLSLEKIIMFEFLDILDPACLKLINNFSMKPYGLIFLKNEIILNKRCNILEFGSGLSSLFMALVLKKYRLNCSLTTVESGEDWIKILEQYVDQLGLGRYLKIIHAPLVQEGRYDQWYDKEILNQELSIILPFDMVIIDGPPAYTALIENSRFEAIPFLEGKLTTNYFILLDDAHRNGEQRILNLWKRKFNISFDIYKGQFAVARKGSFLNSYPSVISTILTKLYFRSLPVVLIYSFQIHEILQIHRFFKIVFNNPTL